MSLASGSNLHRSWGLGWASSKQSSSRAVLCRKKAAMYTLVRLLSVCSLEQVRMGVSGLDIHQFSKAYLLVTDQNYYTKTGGVREARAVSFSAILFGSEVSACMAFSMWAGLYQCLGLCLYLIDFLVWLTVLGLRPTPVVTQEKVKDSTQNPYNIYQDLTTREKLYLQELVYTPWCATGILFASSW